MTIRYVDRPVSTAGPELVVRDFGGDGPPVVLLHGLGGTVDDWTALAPRLTDRYRVVAPELRGHGRSGDGPWSFPAARADLDAVLDRLELPRPALVGASLGGMIAADWAAAGGDATAVVSLDGHRPADTAPDNYLGLDPETLAAHRGRLRAFFDAQSAALAGPVPPEIAAGLPPRSLRDTAEGVRLRPDRTFAEQVRADPGFLDAVPRLERTGCRLLVLVADRDPRGAPPDFAPLMAAYRAGLRRDLTAMAARRTDATVRWWPAGHGMLAEDPVGIAGAVGDFLDAAG